MITQSQGATMSITWGIINAGLTFLLLFAIFRPLEIVFPANRTQRFFRPQFWTDLFYFLGQYLFLNGATFWLLTIAERWIFAATPEALRHAIRELNIWLQLVIVILMGDFLIYWGHR